ncbi:hypothetical protein F5X68DRAFT_263050 [Plectosphaerella plurivora]|uniref:Uncharacterized protein n=1 Tax=Plectosphaerella plurivora TaxID=936078 RepID=A0A9P8V7Z8_9PEZI|nr:hypothetical protein F5X68DRAFT_263050 [Plectosphaerella plurivora]
MLLSLALLACATAAIAASADPGPGLAVRNAPGLTATETVDEVRRRLLRARDDNPVDQKVEIREHFSNVPLFRIGLEKTTETSTGEVTTDVGLEVLCNECYIIGTAVAGISLSMDPFDVGKALDNVTSQFGDILDNITDYAGDFVTGYGRSILDNLGDGIDASDFDVDKVDLPPLQLDLNIPVPEVEECRLRVGFETLDMYIDLRTTLVAAATYTIPIYRKGLAFNVSEVEIDVGFALDLVLSVEAAVVIGHGFHLRFDEGLFMELNLFADEVGILEHNGAQFEFLPVFIEAGGIVLTALLRASISAGINIETPLDMSIEAFGQNYSIPSAGGGVSVLLYADLAKLTTTISTEVGEDEGEDCAIGAIEEFEVALGAAAGASVYLYDRTWGPTAATHTPVFYTTLGRVCIAEEAAATPAVVLRQEEVVTTTTVTYTGVKCTSAGVLDCPASAQSVHKETAVETRAAGGQPGLSTVGFGGKALSLGATSGRPVSWVPPPPTAGVDEKVGQHDEQGVNMGLVIGLSVGLGVPALLAVLGGVL